MKSRKKPDADCRKELEKLKAQNRELDRFVYSASHDLKAPLRSIIGIISIARTETTDDLMLRYLEMVSRSAAKLDNFINDLVNYSRNSRMEVKQEKINFKAMIDEILEDLSHMENASNLKIKTDIQSAECLGDGPRLKIIFSNLISNAIKYQKRQSRDNAELEIRIVPKKEAIEISFSDNGEGISAENQKKVFEMFYRASENSHGSGLGLYIVKEVVGKLNGKIDLVSRPGRGTRFTVYLPNHQLN